MLSSISEESIFRLINSSVKTVKKKKRPEFIFLIVFVFLSSLKPFLFSQPLKSPVANLPQITDCFATISSPFTNKSQVVTPNPIANIALLDIGSHSISIRGSQLSNTIYRLSNRRPPRFYVHTPLSGGSGRCSHN